MSKKQKHNQEVSHDNVTSGADQENIQAEKTDKESPEQQEQQSGETKEEQTGKQQTPSQEETIGKLEIQLAEATDKYLRLFSEFDNFRKRSIKERIELSNTASAAVIASLLPVLDDLERASKMHYESQEKDPSGEGILLIYNKFKNILSQKGVQEIKTIGETFNTDFHDAITHIPAQDENQKGKIVDVVQKGYTLNDKVIRFAQVVVAN